MLNLSDKAANAARAAILEELEVATREAYEACPVGSDYTYRTKVAPGKNQDVGPIGKGRRWGYIKMGERVYKQKHKGGTLRRTVTYEVASAGLTGFVKAGGKRAPYAHLVEFGHKKVGGGMVAPKPFLTPAGERARHRLAPRLGQVLAEEDL